MPKPPPRKRPPAAGSAWRTLVHLNPIKTAVAAVVTVATLLGALPAWWAVEDHFWLRREAVKQQDDHKEDLADLHRRMERSRLWAEHSRLEQTRQRLEKAVRDAGYRRALGARLSPAERMTLEADQADLAATNAALADVKRALNNRP